MAVDDTYTKILMHCNGDDDSTVFTDEAGNTWSIAGGSDYLAISTDHAKFGNASLQLPEYGGTYLTTPISSDLNPGNGDWTVDFWIYYPSISSYGTKLGLLFADEYADKVIRLWMYQIGANTVEFDLQCYGDGGGDWYLWGYPTPVEFTVNQWNHIEFCKHGSSLLLFLNGTLLGSNSTSITGFSFIGGSIRIQKDDVNAGWIDEIRYSKGIARHTSSFTPPTAPYGAPESSSYQEVIEDSIDLLDELRYFAEEIADTVNIIDELADYYESAEDAVYFEDNPNNPIYSLNITEEALLTESSIPILGITLMDRFFIFETAFPNWIKTITDSLNLADLGKPLLGIPVSDWLWLIDSQVNNWNGVEQINQPLNLYDLPSGTRIINRSIAETIGMGDTITLQFLVNVLEYMRFTDLVAVIGTFNRSAADAIRLTDVSVRGFDKLIADTLAAVDTGAILTIFLPSLAESLGIADISSSNLTARKIITDALSLTDVSGSGLHAFTVIQDAIALNVSVEMDGEVYECYVLNTPKFLPSVYSGFDFNSYCVFEGKTYGANAMGIYELTGDTDAGEAIQTGVVMPQTTFGIPNSKKLRRAWLGISGSSPMLVLEVENGTRKAYTIDDYGEVGSDREVSGRKWKLSVANFDELDFIKILPVALAR